MRTFNFSFSRHFSNTFVALALVAIPFSFPVHATATGCRELVKGIPVALPSVVIPSLRDNSLYQPNGIRTESKIPEWIPQYFKRGKRLRPLFVYLSALAHGYTPESVQPLAGLLELIHVGSLTLDDVIDKANERHGEPPLYVGEGLVAGMITGPWLQAYVFRRGPEVTTPAVMARLADVLMAMGDGEILQAELIARKHQGQTYTRAEYERVAMGKTGHLFGFALSATAIHFGLPQNTVDDWTQLGIQIGTSYQIKDDFEDALEEVGEINVAHLMRSERFGGSPFKRMNPVQYLALVEQQTQAFRTENQAMHSLIERLGNSVPQPRTENQQAALDTLGDMVDYVTTIRVPTHLLPTEESGYRTLHYARQILRSLLPARFRSTP
jgi:hypothetical protein